MTITNNKVIQKLFATGNLAGLAISVDRRPKVIATTRIGKKFVLEPRFDNKNDPWVFNQIKQALTQSSIYENFAYVVVDRNTEMTEERNLRLALHDPYQEIYQGVLEAPLIKGHINAMAYHAKQRDGLVTAEQRAGIEVKDAVHRLIFNLKNSKPCNEGEYDRQVNGKYVDIYLNSNSGQWKAIKNSTCKACYAPLAKLKPSDISDEELMELMLANAPELTQ